MLPGIVKNVVYGTFFHRKYGNSVTVNVANPVAFSISGKFKQLLCQEERVPRPLVKKNGSNGFTLFWPSNEF